MNVKEINVVKDHLGQLQSKGFIKEWELPYENLLTRLSAAIFFFTPAQEEVMDIICRELEIYPNFTYRTNEEKKLSAMAYRVMFNQEEKEKNTAKAMATEQ